MAEISTITLKIDVDTDGFKNIETAVKHTSEAIKSANEEIISSYESANRQKLKSIELIKTEGKETSTLAKQLEEVLKKNEESQKKLLSFNRSQFSKEQLEEIERNQREIFENFREIVNQYESIVELHEFYLENSAQLNESLRITGGLLLGIAAGIFAAFAGATAGQILILLAAIAAGIFIMSGGMDEFGRIADDVLKNQVLPLFQNANKGTQEFKQGIDGVGESLKKLEPFKNGLFSDNENFGAVFGLGDIQDVSLKFEISDFDPNKFISSDFESIARNVATYLASGADSSTIIKEELNDIDIPEDLTTFGISPNTSKLGLIFNSRTADERKNTARELTERINQETSLREELERTNKTIDDQTKLFPPLSNALAMAGGEVSAFTIGQGNMSDATNGVLTSVVSLREKGIEPLGGQTDELADRIETASGQVEQAEGKFNTYGISLGDVNALNKVFGVTQDQVNQSLDDGTVAFDSAGASAEEFGNTLDQVQTSGGFFDGIKQGFNDFVTSVESNSELMADFFANTLSQMSQNFSDLFFNVITGKFDDLQDLAKQAFEAILRAFLDLVAAIVTKQIVISIAGVFGFGKESSAASGLDFANQVFGIFEDAGSFFGTGSAAAGAGAAVAGAGGGAIASGAGLGGFAASGLSSVGTANFGAVSVADVFAAGGGLSAVTAGTEAATTGIWATVSAALPWIGAALAAAGLIVTFVLPLLKKTPRFAFKFESIETEIGERAAVVKEFLDADFFSEEIFKKIVGRGGKGAFSGKEVDDLKKAIQKAIEETINSVQEIINKLPREMADILNEALLNTAVDTETKIGRSNLLGFDAKGGKEIKERLEKFFQGDLQGRFLFAIRDFFQFAFEQLGVLPDKAAAFIDTEFERFKNAKSPEERAQIGEEFLASFNAFVDAFNIVSGNVNDAIGQTIQSINSLSSELGFEAVPSIGELTDKLGELLENAELDPETVQKYADLRNAIVQGISDIINSITGLIGKISQLNSTIVSLGGSAVNVIPFLDEAQAKLIDFYTTNLGNLSLGEQEMFLDELLGIANAKLAEEQAAFQRAQEARQKAEEAQRERIEKQIDNLNKEKDKINEVFNKRIEALNEELRIAEDFASLTESIRQTLDSILFSPESVLTGVEQVSALQSNIATLQAQLASTTDPEKQLDIAGRLEEAFKTLFDTAGDAFGVNSPEFVAIFDQVTGGLESLAEFTEGRGRSVEEISAEIERLTAENEATLKSIDAKIEAAQERLANIGQSTADNTFHASQELTELFEFIRTEYMRILEERFAQLGEVSEFGFATEVEGLGVIAGLADESLTVLKGMGEEATSQTGYLSDIAKKLGALAGFQHGSEGLRDFGRGTLAVLHGLEAVITKRDIEAMEQALIGQFASGLSIGSSLSQFHAAQGEESPGLGRRMLLGGGNFIPDIPVNMTGPGTGEPVNHVTEMSVDINVNVNGGSQASIASLAGEIENMMVRSIRQGRVRKELQEAAVRRVA